MKAGTQWSAFVLHEDGTWIQPTYRLVTTSSEAQFIADVLEEIGDRH